MKKRKSCFHKKKKIANNKLSLPESVPDKVSGAMVYP